MTTPNTQLPLHERLGLSPRGPELLAGAVAAIRTNPETYDQSRYEPGPLACDTPGCVASHIVDQDPALRRKARDLAVYGGQGAVGNVAAEGLGLQQRPRLFEGRWPASWLRAAGIEVGHDNYVNPTSDQAATVIEQMLAGKFVGAIVPEAFDPEIDANVF